MGWDDGMEDGPRCCNVGWRAGEMEMGGRSRGTMQY